MPENTPLQQNSRLILWLILFTTPLLGSATDIFVPSLPHISHYFNCPPELTRMSVTTYLIVYGICQLIFGGIVDSFGRRNVMLFALFGSTLSTLWIPFSNSIYTLLILRGVQGFFAAGIGVSNRSIISDTFSGVDLKKNMSYVAVAWGAGPVLSPYLGGYLQHLFNWQASFYFLAAYYFTALLVLFFWLPETIQSRHKFEFQVIGKNYLSIFINPIFIGGAIVCGLTYGVITIYNVTGPFLIEKTLGYNAIVYGHIALFLGIGWFSGNYLVRVIVNRYSVSGITTLFSALFLLISLVLLLFALTNTFNLWTTVVPAVFLFACGGVLFALYLGHSLSLFRHIGGAAAALLGSIFSIFAGVMALIGSWLHTKTLTPLALSYIGLIVVAYFSFYFLVKRKEKKA